MKNLNSAKEKKKPKSQNRRLGNLNDDDCHTHVQGPWIPTWMVLDYVSHHWLSNLISWSWYKEFENLDATGHTGRPFQKLWRRWKKPSFQVIMTSKNSRQRKTSSNHTRMLNWLGRNPLSELCFTNLQSLKSNNIVWVFA
jgi:hypothetical protein